MSNPDTKTSSIDGLFLGFPVSILFVLITILLFQLKDSIPLFKLILWIGLPVITFIITSIVNIVSQYINCNKTDIGKAMLGSLPSIGTILIGLGIASISYCRIPITSVFAPIILGKTIDVTKSKSTMNIASLKNINSKECCIPKLTLENIENNYPIISGISYGFYIMFSILFGMTIGSGIAAIC